jgi:predicted nucleic acid-binding protein
VTAEIRDQPHEPVTIETHDQALDVMRRSGFSIYDSGVVAAAAGAGCTTLYSEDLQDGQRIDSLAVAQPFPHHSLSWRRS